MRPNATASTINRWRKLAETSRLNTGGAFPLPDLVDELCTANHDAIAVRESGRHDDVGRIERLGANRPRFEILRLAVAPDDGFSVAAADNGIAVDDDAGYIFAPLRR